RLDHLLERRTGPHSVHLPHDRALAVWRLAPRADLRVEEHGEPRVIAVALGARCAHARHRLRVAVACLAVLHVALHGWSFGAASTARAIAHGHVGECSPLTRPS